jgi:phage tail sheath protein FI
VALGGYTLADDDAEVLHLHVRRLLVLLRRLALRHGHQWVFEPNSPAFQRAVRGLFDEVMRELFRRGAFAGDRPSSAYDIRVQPDPRDTDQGRFIVELRVAPAVPLRFLTVRLVQDDARGLTTEGV